MNVKGGFRTFYKELVSLKGEPKPIAMGMAIGVFVGVTPTIPFHTVLIVLIGILFRQNITSACLGSCLISNPLTIPVFYVVEYEVGRRLLVEAPRQIVLTDHTLWSIMGMGWDIILPLLVGGIIIAPIFAIPAYFITHRIISAIHKKRRP